MPAEAHARFAKCRSKDTNLIAPDRDETGNRGPESGLHLGKVPAYERGAKVCVATGLDGRQPAFGWVLDPLR